ncbi:hypothetical protein KFK09_022638 [Dendrobium nobile]|uniref:Uncharacterized protein n=1 Tax=Dendrobium nobile TaxID=94219 RepID=A0A8T3AKI0_DENNO|nr:hypothetical protein KFK09_022638 [Dendrobium nobile]
MAGGGRSQWNLSSGGPLQTIPGSSLLPTGLISMISPGRRHHPPGSNPSLLQFNPGRPSSRKVAEYLRARQTARGISIRSHSIPRAPSNSQKLPSSAETDPSFRSSKRP